MKLNATLWVIVWMLTATNSTWAASVPPREAILGDGPIASPERGWPQWRGPRRDGISDESGLLVSWPEGGPALVWRVNQVGRGWSSPIVAGDRLYITGDVGGDLVLLAFDLGGKSLWRATNGAAWKGPWPGARACAVYAGGMLYHMNAHGRVAAFDAATGSERWGVMVLEQFEGRNITWALSECLVVDGPRVLVTPGGAKALMAALDRQTGRTLWCSEPLPDNAAAHASPLLFRHANRRIVASLASQSGFGLDADTGKLLWSVPQPHRLGVNVSTPIYSNGHIFYVTPDEYGAALYRLDFGRPGPPVERVWRSPLDTLTGSPVLVGGRLFAVGCKKTKSLQCLDWQTGQPVYELARPDTRNTRWGAGALLWADGRLYSLFEDGMMMLLKPGPDAFEVTGQFRLVEAEKRDAWAHPVLYQGRLYLRYHETLWCFDVRARKGL